MAQPHLRLTCVAATTAAAALAATPALATEPGPPAATPPPPAALVVPNLVPFPGAPRSHARPTLRRVRVVPRRIRRGQRARVQLRLSAPAQLRVLVQRRAGRRLVRIRTIVVGAPAGAVSVRLPRRLHGRALKAGRYRVSVVAVDATGSRSTTYLRTLRIRRRAR